MSAIHLPPSGRVLAVFILSALVCAIAAQHPLSNMQHEEEDIVESTETRLLPYHVLPVYGNASLGYYYVNIYVGSPEPQPQTVIVDTGSGILAVPCTECHSCGRNHLNPPYNPSNSTASRQLICRDKHPSCLKKCSGFNDNENCTFSIYYAEGSSLSGVLIEDDIRFETYSSNEQIRAALGCTQKETNLFVTQKANGIFGLAPVRESNLLEELITKHSQSGEKKEFSLCLSPNGGLMTVGGRNTALHAKDVQPTISIGYRSDSNLYTLVGVQEISLDETFIFTSLNERFTGYGIFVDSGSTFSYLPKHKYEILEEKLNKTCVNSRRCQIGRGEDSICYQLDLQEGQKLETEVEKLFPPIRYKMLNKNIEWAPTKYMLLREEAKHEVCLGVLPLDRYLLGANWMYNRDIVFDLENKMLHIYDQVSCEKDAKAMGRYLDDDAVDSHEIVFSNATQLFSGLKVNTKGPMFVMGIIFLSLGCIGFVLMILGVCESSKKPTKEVALSQDQEAHEQLEKPDSLSEMTESTTNPQ